MFFTPVTWPRPRFAACAARGAAWALPLVAVQTIAVVASGEAARENLCDGGFYVSALLGAGLLLTAAIMWLIFGKQAITVAEYRARYRAVVSAGRTFDPVEGVQALTNLVITPIVLRCGTFFLPLIISSLLLKAAFSVDS